MAQYEEIYLPDDLYYDPKDHLWSRVEPEGVRIGMDQFGQKAAGTVAYIKLLPVDRSVVKGRAFGSLEAGKYIGPLKAQVNGKIIAVNEEVLKQPTLVNTDPYNAWFVVIKPSNLEADLADRISGEKAIQSWLETEYRTYVEKGLFAEK